jgi:hypothetical protein
MRAIALSMLPQISPPARPPEAHAEVMCRIIDFALVAVYGLNNGSVQGSKTPLEFTWPFD